MNVFWKLGNEAVRGRAWMLAAAMALSGIGLAMAADKPAPAGLPAAGVSATDPEWVKASAELKKLDLPGLKKAWAENEAALMTHGSEIQKLRQDLWKLAQEARQNDPKCKAIRDEIEKLRAKMEDTALEAPTVAPAVEKIKASERQLGLTLKKRQLLGTLLRDVEMPITKPPVPAKPAPGPTRAQIDAAEAAAPSGPPLPPPPTK